MKKMWVFIFWFPKISPYLTSEKLILSQVSNWNLLPIVFFLYTYEFRNWIHDHILLKDLNPFHLDQYLSIFILFYFIFWYFFKNAHNFKEIIFFLKIKIKIECPSNYTLMLAEKHEKALNQSDGETLLLWEGKAANLTTGGVMSYDKMKLPVLRLCFSDHLSIAW